MVAVDLTPAVMPGLVLWRRENDEVSFANTTSGAGGRDPQTLADIGLPSSTDRAGNWIEAGKLVNGARFMALYDPLRPGHSAR
jgi:hypothetical protein